MSFEFKFRRPSLIRSRFRVVNTLCEYSVDVSTSQICSSDFEKLRQAGEEACERGEEGGWRQEGAGDEEGRQGYLRAEAAQRGARGDLRQEVDAAHRGSETSEYKRLNTNV